MILQFKVSNYRSYKDEVTFSMEAEASKQKGNNIFEFQLGNQQSVKYLKTAAIYGANASGKTNLIRSLYDLINFILEKPKADERIALYEPYLFDNEYRAKPSYFELTFIGPGGYKYIYKLLITGTAVLEEELNYYPNNRVTNLFTRSAEPGNRIHLGILGDSKDKKQMTVFSNQLLLSKFGDDEPDELLSDVFLHFRNYFVMNVVSNRNQDDLQLSVSQELFNNKLLQKKVALLIQAADTKISGIQLDQIQDQDIDHLNPETRAIIKRNPYIIYAIHDLYDGETKLPNRQIGVNIQQESKGSQTLYVLGGKVLSTIENGGVLIVDELDTSLHPFITKLIVLLFQSEKINKKGAQLIFTTHDVSLLDKDLLRKDQIWFAEKSDMGTTDFYSLQDFEGLREDTPFEKWYLAGKFGALPNIQSLEKIFEDVSAD